MKVLIVIKRVVCFMMTAMLISSAISIDVQAKTLEQSPQAEVEELLMISRESVDKESISEQNVRALLYNCIMSVHCGSNGMQITFSTDCVQDAATIGVKDIVIKQKVWYGWKTVATSSGGYYTNASTYMGSILYANAIKGENYRITCTHYADADEYTEVDGELELIFTY